MATAEKEWARKVWQAAAEAKGWRWEPAYNGYIRADHHPDGPACEHRSYPSDLDAEDACFVDGLDTLDKAAAFLDEQVQS